jgi:hypothetical protein
MDFDTKVAFMGQVGTHNCPEYLIGQPCSMRWKRRSGSWRPRKLAYFPSNHKDFLPKPSAFVRRCCSLSGTISRFAFLWSLRSAGLCFPAAPSIAYPWPQVSTLVQLVQGSPQAEGLKYNHHWHAKFVADFPQGQVQPRSKFLRLHLCPCKFLCETVRSDGSVVAEAYCNTMVHCFVSFFVCSILLASSCNRTRTARTSLSSVLFPSYISPRRRPVS